MAESIWIVGGGALGTLLASRLERAGHSVSVLVRSDAGAAGIARAGRSVAIVRDPASADRPTLAFVCVKARDTEGAARSIATLPPPRPVVCTLQNGWGHLEVLASTLPDAPLVAGATTLGAYFDAAGDLHASTEGTTLLAPWTGGDARSAEYVAAVFRSAGLAVETRPDARAVLWRKLTLNAAVNPLTALLDQPNGTLLDHPPLLRVALAAAGEAALTGIRLGYLPATFDPAPVVETLLEETRENRSSMAEDLARGRPTESDAILGAAIRAARDAGEATPVLEALWTLLRAAETGRRATPPSGTSRP